MHGELPRQMWAKTFSGKTGSRTRRYLAIAVVLIVIAGALYYVFGGSTAPKRAGGRFGADTGPVPVLVAAAQKADVPVYLYAVGTTKALNTVTVRPQVDGKLIQVAFGEGQDVKKDDVLARIDPTTYQAQLDQAVAKKAQDEASLANAKVDLDRYEKLAATNSINRQQADTQRSLVAQLQAQVQNDQGAIDNARAILAYTTIRAPLDGRTGIRPSRRRQYRARVGFDRRGGNHATQADLGILQSAAAEPRAGQQRLRKNPLTAEAQRSDNDAVIDRGVLKVVDNQVDASTGTVKLKAEFPNADLQLWPGQFVNVRLLIDTLKQVVVIPTGAVQRGPNGTFVYVVKDDSTVTMRPIDVQKQDETQTVVSKGLTPPERVVTTGFVRLTDNAKVTISSGDGTPAAGAPSGRRQRGTGNAAKPAAAPDTPQATPPAAPQ
ncbi:MAG: efflux RND transporter periplasmic adaptor subunit [Pseudolabrys sp.]